VSPSFLNSTIRSSHFGGGSCSNPCHGGDFGFPAVASGADFAALAKRYSEDPNAADGGAMGWIAQGDLMPELDTALFSVPVGSVSEPIQTRLGFHLVKVEERRTASDLSVADANRAVYQRLYQQKFEAAMKRWLTELKSRAYIQIL